MFPFYLCRKHHLHLLGWEQSVPGTRPMTEPAECLLCRRAFAEVEGKSSQLRWPAKLMFYLLHTWSVIVASLLSPAPPFLQSVINTATFRRAAFTATLSATLPNCTRQGFKPVIPHDLGPGAAHLGLTSHHSTVRCTRPRVRLGGLRPGVSALWMRPGGAPWSPGTSGDHGPSSGRPPPRQPVSQGADSGLQAPGRPLPAWPPAVGTPAHARAPAAQRGGRPAPRGMGVRSLLPQEEGSETHFLRILRRSCGICHQCHRGGQGCPRVCRPPPPSVPRLSP